MQPFEVIVLLIVWSTIVYDAVIMYTGKPIDEPITRDVSLNMLQYAMWKNDRIVTPGNLSKLLPCVKNYTIKNTTLIRSTPIAYVCPHISNEIYINSKSWDPINFCEKARILIHECTHLVLKTDDIAYFFDPGFKKLRGNKFMKNADSIAMWIKQQSPYCF